jgi:transcription elongation factor GreA
LREELAKLKKEDRPKIIAAIAEARAHGDLKENAEYHAAREQQGFIEGRIQHLESTISHAQIIDVEKLSPGDKVVFGATVTLSDEETAEETTYQIVGDVEADIKRSHTVFPPWSCCSPVVAPLRFRLNQPIIFDSPCLALSRKTGCPLRR